MDTHKKVKFRQVLSIFSLIFLPLLLLAIILGYYSYQTESVLYEEHTRSNEVQFLTQVKRQAFHDFNMIFSDLTSLVSNHTITPSLDSNSTALVNLEKDMLSFSKSKHVYDQIRLIDLDGQELVRINNRNAHPEIVPKSELQNKDDRYYFNKILNLGEGDIYISPLDLNIENGQIEEPFKPVIRFGSVAFDKQGQKRGILLFNFLAEHLLNELKTFGRELSQGQFMFLNIEGFWLGSHDPAQEWGFMFDEGITFGQKFQEAWPRIQQGERGQFETDEGLFTFVTIRPLYEYEESDIQSLLYIQTISSSNVFPHDYSWKAVTLIPRDKLYAANRKLFKEISALLVFLLLPMALVCWWAAYSLVKRKLIEIDLNTSKERLQLALDGSRDGLWDWDLVTNEVYLSPRWKEMLGYEDHEIQNHSDEWGKRVHPEDLTLAKDTIQAYIEGKTPSLEFLHR
ncbi:MAG: PAS domain-containing protein, partial [Desulfuromonadales bacterium]|nr:PAS domain-containing protein [Desulfuromonadales bacterium]